MDGLNVIFIVGIIIFAVYTFFSANNLIRKGCKDLKRILKILKLESIEDIDQFEIALAEEKLEYNSRKVLRIFFSQYRKYKVPISEYVNYENYVDRLKKHGSSSVPGILTAAGILGTFIGLNYSISHFDTSTAESIMSGIDGMLGGLGLAFSTSITGIAASVFWNILDKRQTKKSMQLIDNIEDTFSRKFEVDSEDDFEAFFKQNQLELKEIQLEQKEALQHLATDLSISISNAFSENFTNNLTPILEKISDGFEEMSATTTDAYVEGIGSVADQFVESMNSSMNGQFQNLAETLEQTCEWQKQIKADMDELINELQDSVRDQKEINISTESVIEQFSTIFTDFSAISSSISQNFSEIYEKAEGMNEVLTQNVEKASEHIKKLSQLQEELVNKYDKSLEYNNSVQENVLEMSDVIANAKEAIHEMNESLGNSSKEFKENLHGGLIQAFETFDNNLSKLSNYLNDNIRNLDQTLENVDESIEGIRTSIFMINENFEKYVDNRYKTIEQNIEASIDKLVKRIDEIR